MGDHAALSGIQRDKYVFLADAASFLRSYACPGGTPPTIAELLASRLTHAHGVRNATAHAHFQARARFHGNNATSGMAFAHGASMTWTI